MNQINIVVYLYIIIGCIISICYANIEIYPIDFENSLESKLGLGWPHTLYVAAGHEALLKLSRFLVNQDSCIIHTPQGETFNLNSLPSNRFERWTDGCGVRVKNLNSNDEGRWRVTSTHGNDSLTGYSEIHILEAITNYTGPSIYLQDELSNALVNLTTLNNDYCMVTQPFTQSTLVSGNCEVTLSKTSRAVQGTWNALLGLPGQVSELHIERQVTVEGEHLDVGYIHDVSNSKLHLYCNIVHGQKNITFCRFQRTSGSFGYNVIDGLSDGLHSYYGDGFIMKHCGMTVEHPAEEDFSTWRCSVGVQEIDANQEAQRGHMQALITIVQQRSELAEIQQYDEDEERSVFTQVGTILTINCKTNEALSYCWFQHPNGSEYTPPPKLNTDGDGDENTQPFWYSGESLQMGDCGISFAAADEGLSGRWACHMGLRAPGAERTGAVRVRVAGALAARARRVRAAAGARAALACRTAGAPRALLYCRFVTPGFVGFNIDATVTADDAILGRYYFTPGASLDYGDCSITIDSVSYEDRGNWTCAAMIVGELLESNDHLELVTLESKLSAASIVAISFCSLAVLAVPIVFVLYKRGCVGRRAAAPRVSMRGVAARGSASSASTDDSVCTVPDTERGHHN